MMRRPGTWKALQGMCGVEESTSILLSVAHANSTAAMRAPDLSFDSSPLRFNHGCLSNQRPLISGPPLDSPAKLLLLYKNPVLVTLSTGPR